MTTTEQWDAAYDRGTFDGSDDEANPARYLLMAGILRDHNTVLDVGCGVGHVCNYFFGFYSGVDISAVAITKAKEQYGSDCFEFHCAKAQDWQPNGRRFDAVILNEVLYYDVGDKVELLKKYFAIARRTMIVSIYNKSVLPWHPNVKALKAALMFGEMNKCLRHTVSVGENGKFWNVMVFERD